MNQINGLCQAPVRAAPTKHISIYSFVCSMPSVPTYQPLELDLITYWASLYSILINEERISYRAVSLLLLLNAWADTVLSLFRDKSLQQKIDMFNKQKTLHDRQLTFAWDGLRTEMHVAQSPWSGYSQVSCSRFYQWKIFVKIFNLQFDCVRGNVRGDLREPEVAAVHHTWHVVLSHSATQCTMRSRGDVAN